MSNNVREPRTVPCVNDQGFGVRRGQKILLAFHKGERKKEFLIFF